ncbi:cytochrome b/b6 domain-containing protein [Mucilaginibacter kameinonensis]|uniref:cytochrome b/b6 domain-containing protein n=1 Tax=Mucilaginibacter kameinonensis TaxID=452286 RepID=UPI000EF767A4|nr:cytochrome b/b6 domain-containing protein [Mucilaginibacter kameinonensis]
MNELTSVIKDMDHSPKNKRYSSRLRLWHWLNALVIIGSLLTVLINSTILDSRNASPLIISALANKQVNVNNNQARAVAHDLADKVWEWHTYFGFALAALFLFRLGLEFFQLAERKLSRSIAKAYRQFFIIKQQRELAGHEFWVKTIYTAFYLVLLISVITGFDLALEADFPALRKFHFLKAIHELNMYLILLFILVHVAGVFLAERTAKDKGIVSDMINGGKQS